MCIKHPTYKAIRKPKKLKLTGTVCPDCWNVWAISKNLQGVAEVIDPDLIKE